MPDVLTDEQAQKNIAANVKRLRGNRSLGWLARLVDSYPINISRIEDASSMPGGGMLSRLAEVLGVTVDDLLSTPPAPQKKPHSRRVS
jgi:transcriptional regulator with XRE-family HTH domain